MGKTAKYWMLSLLAVFLLSACNSTSNDSDEGVFQYKETLIGNNSSVIHIIGQLWNAEAFQQVALQTDSEPYGMTIAYEDVAEDEYEETVMHNASYLFALIDNAEWIVFDFGERQYEITRSVLEDWYDEELADVKTEDDLRGIVREKLNDEEEMSKLFEQ